MYFKERLCPIKTASLALSLTAIFSALRKPAIDLFWQSSGSSILRGNISCSSFKYLSPSNFSKSIFSRYSGFLMNQSCQNLVYSPFCSIFCSSLKSYETNYSLFLPVSWDKSQIFEIISVSSGSTMTLSSNKEFVFSTPSIAKKLSTKPSAVNNDRFKGETKKIIFFF